MQNYLNRIDNNIESNEVIAVSQSEVMPTEVIQSPDEFASPQVHLENHQVPSMSSQTLPVKKSELKKDQMNLRVKLKEFIDLTYVMNDSPILKSSLVEINALLNSAKTVIQNYQKSSLIERKSPLKCKHQPSKINTKKKKKFKYAFRISKRHPYSNRVGQRAEMMRQLYRAKIFIRDTLEDETKERHVINQVALPCTSDLVILDSDPVVTKVVKANRQKKDMHNVMSI